MYSVYKVFWLKLTPSSPTIWNFQTTTKSLFLIYLKRIQFCQYVTMNCDWYVCIQYSSVLLWWKIIERTASKLTCHIRTANLAPIFIAWKFEMQIHKDNWWWHWRTFKNIRVVLAWLCIRYLMRKGQKSRFEFYSITSVQKPQLATNWWAGFQQKC